MALYSRERVWQLRFSSCECLEKDYVSVRDFNRVFWGRCSQALCNTIKTNTPIKTSSKAVYINIQLLLNNYLVIIRHYASCTFTKGRIQCSQLKFKSDVNIHAGKVAIVRSNSNTSQTAALHFLFHDWMFLFGVHFDIYILEMEITGTVHQSFSNVTHNFFLSPFLFAIFKDTFIYKISSFQKLHLQEKVNEPCGMTWIYVYIYLKIWPDLQPSYC